MSELNAHKDPLNQAEDSVFIKLNEMIHSAELALDEDVDKALYLAFDANQMATDIDSTNHIAETHFILGNVKMKQRLFDEALSQYELAHQFFLELGNKEKLGATHHKMGTVYLYLGNQKRALEKYTEAKIIKAELNEEIPVADIDANLGVIYHSKGSYSSALKSYLSALKTYEHFKIETKIASVCTNIGVIYLEQKNYEEAMKMFNRALVIHKNANNISSESILLNNIGNIYKDKEDYEQSLLYHQRALEIKTQLQDAAGISNSLNNIGSIYLHQRQFDEAIDFLQRSLALRQQIGDKKGIVESYINLSEIYYEQALYEKAKSLLYSALSIAKEKDFKYQLRDIYEALSKIFALECNYEKAYEFLSKFSAAQNEVLNIETSQQMAQMSVRYEMEQKEREMEVEQAKNLELQKAYESLDLEKNRAEELLHNILPSEVAEELKSTGKSVARHYDLVTVLFADIKGFTMLSEMLQPQELMDTIDLCFRTFDDIVEAHGVEKIKVIGDCYMCAGGIPTPNTTNPIDVVKSGMAFIEALQGLNDIFQQKGLPQINFRVGIHSGPLISGIVGRKKFAYDIWGDTVNIAARLEQSGVPGKVNISGMTYELIKDSFNCSYRGKVDAKNKGKIDMYFVENII